MLLLCLFQHLLQIFSGVGTFALCHLLRCSGRNNLTASISSLGSKVDDIVCCFDDIQIMLDDHHRIAGIHQRLKHLDELVYIRCVQTGSRFIQDVDGSAGRSFGKLGRQFDPLRLSARKRPALTVQRQIRQPTSTRKVRRD